jgi:hypothetical protein
MLTDSALRSAIDGLWDKLWAGGLSNPMDAIEQLSYLLFLKRLDEREQDALRVSGSIPCSARALRSSSLSFTLYQAHTSFQRKGIKGCDGANEVSFQTI